MSYHIYTYNIYIQLYVTILYGFSTQHISEAQTDSCTRTILLFTYLRLPTIYELVYLFYVHDNVFSIYTQCMYIIILQYCTVYPVNIISEAQTDKLQRTIHITSGFKLTGVHNALTGPLFSSCLVCSICVKQDCGTSDYLCPTGPLGSS